MKKFLCLILSLSVICILPACSVPEDEVLLSLGDCESKEFYSRGEFRDYTDYAKYAYSQPSLEDNAFFAPVSDSDISVMYEYIDNFEEWVSITAKQHSSDELSANYDFDRSIIDTQDYFYIYDRMGEPIGSESAYEKFDFYNVYFFDYQTSTLYFFHNNT